MHNSLQQDFSGKFLYNHGKAVTFIHDLFITFYNVMVVEMKW